MTTLAPVRRTGLLAATFLGTFMALLDVSVVSVALPAIERDLHTGFAGQQWIVDGYTVALAATVLTGGNLGDRYGRKRVYLAGIALFTVASLGCALAPGLGALLLARLVQGVAAAAVIPGALSLLAHGFPDHAERAKVLGWWSSIGALAFIAGPLIGGPLTETLGWPTIFLLNLPLGVLAVLTGRRGIAESADPAPGGADITGQLLGALWIGALTYGVIEAGRLGWTAPGVLVPLAVGVCGLLVFVTVELRSAAPMLPLRQFGDRRFATVGLASFLLGFCAYPMVFLVALYLQQGRGAGAAEAGVQLLPYVLGNVLAAFCAGRLAARFGVRRLLPSGYLVAALGAFGFLLLDADSPYWTVAMVLAASGAGLGLSLTPTNLLGLSGLPRERSGVASATVNAARQTGMALGVAVLGALIALRPVFVDGLHLALSTAGALLLVVSVLTTVTLNRSPGRATS